MKFNKHEIQLINDCLQTYHNDDTMTIERATHDEIVECVDCAYDNDEYDHDVLSQHMTTNDERELIDYVNRMIEIARLHVRVSS